MSQIEGTVNDGEEDSDFISWLRRHKVKQKMIKKLVDEIDSIDELVIIEDDKIDLIAKDLNLSALEQNKFKYIIEKAKSESNTFYSFVDKEEIEAVTKMETKLRSIQNAINLVSESKKNINQQVSNHTRKIHSTFKSFHELLNKRETRLIEQLNKIAADKKQKSEQKLKELNQTSTHSQQEIKACNKLLKKRIELNEIETRKKTIIKKATDIDNIQVMTVDDTAVTGNKIDLILDEAFMIKIINSFGNVYGKVIPILTSLTDNKNCTISVEWKWSGNKPKQVDAQEKVQMEWRESESKNDDNKYDDDDDVKQEWTRGTEFALKNVNNLTVNIKVPDKGATYLVRVKYFDGKLWSNSNVGQLQHAVCDTWDLNLIGKGMVINGRTVQYNNPLGEQSAFFCNVVETGTHTWTFKVHKCNTNWVLIGIWKTKSGQPPVNTYFTKSSNGYAYVIGKCVTTTRGSHGSKYGVICKCGDIVEMKLDCDKSCLSYKVNNTDYGKAFDVEQTKYRAAICFQVKDDKIEFIKYETK